MSKIFLGQPCYGAIELESADAVDVALHEGSEHDLTAIRHSSSLLANCFNTLLAMCLETNEERLATGEGEPFTYFGLLHADVAPGEGWLDTLVAELDSYQLDVIHAPCALKDGKGLTSTAIAYADDPWRHYRRITTTELADLWPTFTVRTIREQLDPEAWALLPNTGCLLIRLGDWLRDFPGFNILDRLVYDPAPRPGATHWRAAAFSEDWNFGLWCHRRGLKVGATSKVKTRHIGRVPFLTEVAFGQARDETFFELQAAERKAA